MNDEQALREVLARLTPADPGGTDRADLARRIARRSVRRRTVIVGVGSIALVAAAIAPFTGDGRGVDHTPMPAITQGCPAPAERGEMITELVDSGPERVARGAVSVRLCSPGGINPWRAPYEALESDVDAVVDQINAAPLRPIPERVVCPADGGIGFGYLFTYPGGATRYVVAQTYGCRGLYLGGSHRGDQRDAWKVYAAFRKALLAQRGFVAAPKQGTFQSPECLTRSFVAARSWVTLLPIKHVPDLTQVRFCVYRSDGAGRTEATTVTLPPADARHLAGDIRDHAGRRQPTGGRPAYGCAPVEVAAGLVGIDAWGDRYDLQDTCVGEYTIFNGTFWYPDPRSRAILDDLKLTHDVE